MGKLNRYLNCTSGNTAIIFALAAVPMLLVAGASIDMARASRSQAMLQAAADAAALAAGSNIEQGKVGQVNLNNTVASLVHDFAMANGAGSALDSLDEVDSSFDGKTGKLTVRLRGKMNTSLMKLAGYSVMDIEAVSEVIVNRKALEVVMVLDNTGSMAGSKIGALKIAATNLTESVFDNVGPMSHVKMGVVPFSEYVNVGTGPQSGGWLENDVSPPGATWEGCIGSRPSPEDKIVKKSNGTGKFTPVGGVNCVTPLLPLTNDKSAVLAKINGMGSEGNTYIPGGLLWGWHVLEAAEPIGGALSEAELQKINGTKAIVLMTDGANTISPAYPMHTNTDVATSNQLTRDLCANAKSAGIKVFTVAFEVTDPTILDIMQNCANEPSMAYDAANGAALNTAFNEIAEQLSSIHISK